MATNVGVVFWDPATDHYRVRHEDSSAEDPADPTVHSGSPPMTMRWEVGEVRRPLIFVMGPLTFQNADGKCNQRPIIWDLAPDGTITSPAGFTQPLTLCDRAPRTHILYDLYVIDPVLGTKTARRAKASEEMFSAERLEQAATLEELERFIPPELMGCILDCIRDHTSPEQLQKFLAAIPHRIAAFILSLLKDTRPRIIVQ